MAQESMVELDVKELEKSIKKVQNKLDNAEKIIIEEIERVSILIAFDLLGEAMRRAPKETGHLRGSGIAKVNDEKVAHTEGKGDITKDKDFIGLVAKAINEVVGEVAFNTPYAAIQHEEMGFHHDDGEAKYLERPLNERIEVYQKWFAERIEKRLSKESL